MTKFTTPFKSALLAVSLSIVLCVILILAQFLLQYKYDLFNNHLDIWVIAKFCILGVIDVSSFVIIINVLVFGIVYYRHFFRTKESKINEKIRKALFPVMAFSFGCFIWNAFIIPIAFLHLNGLLWDIDMKKPGKLLTRTSVNRFSGFLMSRNFFEIEALTDSSNAKISLKKKGIVKTILKVADTSEVNKLLQDSLIKAAGISKKDFVIAEIENNSHGTDTATTNKYRKQLHFYIQEGAMDIENEKYSILKNRIQLFKMIGFPFVTILAYFIGMFIGILNRDQKYLLIPFIGVYCTVFPGIYYLNIWLDKLIKEQKTTPFLGQLYYILILTIITLLLYRYSKTSLRANKNYTEQI